MIDLADYEAVIDYLSRPMDMCQVLQAKGDGVLEAACQQRMQAGTFSAAAARVRH